MSKKAIFLDMDDTTLNSQRQISREDQESLRRALQGGHQVVVTTGRALSSARRLLELHGLEQMGCRYVIAYNGGMLYDVQQERVLYRKTMELDWVRTLIREARKRELYFQTYEKGEVLTETVDANLEHYLQKTGMGYRQVPDLEQGLKEEPCKALAIHLTDRSRLEAFREELSGWAQDKLEMYCSCQEYLDIMPKGVSKGSALAAYCQQMGVAPADTVAVGDELNDVSMIRQAGVGCAVANAREEVKAEADYVTKRDHDHSAVTEVLERFVL